MSALFSRRGLIPAFILTGAWYIACIRFIPEPWCAPFKLLPLALLVAAIVRSNRGRTEDRAGVVLPVVALSLSMAGDLFGDVKLGGFADTAFLLQILFFMAAHFVYIAAFLRYYGRPRPDTLPRREKSLRWLCIIGMVTYLVIYSNVIIPKIGDATFRYAAGAYMIVIATMFLSSVLQTREGVWTIVLGALLFVCSDSILAWTSFIPDHGIPVLVEDIAVMGTYYSAQLLLNIGLVRKKD